MITTTYKRTLERIADILWPAGDPDSEWSADTTAAIADIMRSTGFAPEDRAKPEPEPVRCRGRRDHDVSNIDYGDEHNLYDYETGSWLRVATNDEYAASYRNSKHDGGAGVILVGTVRCYVV